MLEGTSLRAEPGRRSSEVLFDSFDRRLAHAGLELRRAAGEPAPAFVWDLPFALARRFADVLEARALRPIGEHALESSCWAVLDDQHKVVARVVEELHELRPSGADAPSRIRRIVLEGVRGYDAELARLAGLLAPVPGLAPVSDASFDAYARLGPLPRRRGRWPTLAPDVQAFEALAAIARAQLSVLRANGAGLLADEDAEFLHDVRVAMRRLRSLISQLDGVLLAHEQEHLREELRWLATCTGPARDLDTLLFELRLTEPGLRQDLEPVLAAFADERERIQTRLRADYGSERARALRARLRRVFSGLGDPSCAGPKAAEAFTALLGRRLRRRFRQVLAQAGRLAPHSPAAELHELRISCKKLRYLLECCRGLVPKEDLAASFAHLKGLQAALGTIQDAEVHLHLLHELLLGAAERGGPHAHVALGQFLERTAQRGRLARERYGGLSRSFLGQASRAQLEGVLHALERSPADER